jgi:hypothetical protein
MGCDVAAKEIFLYEWWPLLRKGRLYQKLSRMPVEVRKRA